MISVKIEDRIQNTEDRRQKMEDGRAQGLKFSRIAPSRLLSFVFRPLSSAFRLSLGLFLLVAPFFIASISFSEGISDPVEIEYAVKAGFLYNFTKFTQWPESAFQKGQEEFIIGVLGKDPFGESLNLLAAQKKAQKRKIVVRHFSSSDDITECHIFFISPSEGRNLEKILAKIGEKPILIVGDTQGFGEKGVAVNFFIQDEKVRFEFNRKALEKAGIKVSSQLLHLGKIIE